jgi:hypothetical protein
LISTPLNILFLIITRLIIFKMIIFLVAFLTALVLPIVQLGLSLPELNIIKLEQVSGIGQNDACSAQEKVSSNQAEATVNFESQHLNISGVIEFANITVITTCSTQMSWNESTVFQASNKSYMKSQEIGTVVHATSSPSSLSAIVSSLAFDKNTTPQASATQFSPAPFTSSGSRFYWKLPDSFAFILAAAVYIGII